MLEARKTRVPRGWETPKIEDGEKVNSSSKGKVREEEKVRE